MLAIFSSDFYISIWCNKQFLERITSETLEFKFKTFCSVIKVGLQHNLAVKINSAGKVNIALLWPQLVATDSV